MLRGAARNARAPHSSVQGQLAGLAVEARQHHASLRPLGLVERRGWRLDAHARGSAVAEVALGVGQGKVVGGVRQVHAPDEATEADGVDLLRLAHARVDNSAEGGPKLELGPGDAYNLVPPGAMRLHQAVAGGYTTRADVERINQGTPRG